VLIFSRMLVTPLATNIEQLQLIRFITGLAWAP
jgi:hypothetical protein